MCSDTDYAHLLGISDLEAEAGSIAGFPDEVFNPGNAPDRDACPDCLPLGTFPDGSGWPCTKHQPLSTEQVIERLQRVAPERDPILVAVDALGLPDCAPGCTCRGNAL